MDMHKLASREHGTSNGLQQQYEKQMNLLFTTKLKALQDIIRRCVSNVSNRMRFSGLHVTNLILSLTAYPNASDPLELRPVIDTVIVECHLSINFDSGLLSDERLRLMAAMEEVSVAAARALGATHRIQRKVRPQRTVDNTTTFGTYITLERYDTAVTGHVGDLLRSLRRNKREDIIFDFNLDSVQSVVPDGIVPSLNEFQLALPQLCNNEVHAFTICTLPDVPAAANNVHDGCLGVAYEFKTGLDMYSV